MGHLALRRRQGYPAAGYSKSKRVLERLEAEANVSKYIAGGSYHEWEIEQLRSDRELAVECLKVSLETLDNPDERGGSLLMLRALAEAFGGLGAVAAQAGISRESLYRSLSPKGNPTLKTLIAVVNVMGLRLSVVEERQAKKKRSRSRIARKAA